MGLRLGCCLCDAGLAGGLSVRGNCMTKLTTSQRSFVRLFCNSAGCNRQSASCMVATGVLMFLLFRFKEQMLHKFVFLINVDSFSCIYIHTLYTNT